MRYLLLALFIIVASISIAVAQEETPEPSAPIQTVEPMATHELVEWLESVQSVLDTQTPNWYLSAVFNNATNTRVTWFEACCLGVVTIEEIRFCCAENMATTFSYDQNMLPYYQATLVNYSPFELIESCEIDSTTIHLFKGISNGYEFYIRHYHQENGLTVRNTGLYFRQLPELERYSQIFFPDMTCPVETQPESTEESP